MNGDPIDLALRHVIETKQLLETVVVSSESFDYPRAKLTLKALQKKVRELAKVQAALEAQRCPAALPANVVVLSALAPRK